MRLLLASAAVAGTSFEGVLYVVRCTLYIVHCTFCIEFACIVICASNKLLLF